jgi:hypothetical protein
MFFKKRGKLFELVPGLAEKTIISANRSMRPVSSSSSAPVEVEANLVSSAIFDSYVYKDLTWSW